MEGVASCMCPWCEACRQMKQLSSIQLPLPFLQTQFDTPSFIVSHLLWHGMHALITDSGALSQEGVVWKVWPLVATVYRMTDM